MTTPLPNQIIREITPLSDKDCFYIAERYKTEFTYPIHNHSEFELNFTEKAAGVRRVVGDSSEVIGDYDLVLITGKERVPFERDTGDNDPVFFRSFLQEFYQ